MFNIDEKLLEKAKELEQQINIEFEKTDEICATNSLKVLNAFQEHSLSELHFGTTTGYGYGDVGRNTIERIFSSIFKSEDSLVRTQFISGTHALTVALFGILRPGDTMVSINGKLYDTLDSVIGIEENSSSLNNFRNQV